MLVLEWLAALIALLAIAVMLIGTVRFLVGFIRAETLKTEANRARII